MHSRPWVPMEEGVGRECWIFSSCIYIQVVVSLQMQVLGTKLWSAGRETSALNSQAIFSTLYYNYCLSNRKNLPEMTPGQGDSVMGLFLFRRT